MQAPKPEWRATGQQAAARAPPSAPPKALAVGGSDGSGTRSVVALLEDLGVNMVVDDRGTNDVHADEMGGWPGWGGGPSAARMSPIDGGAAVCW